MTKKIILTDRVKRHLDYDLLEELNEFELITAYSNEEALRIHRDKRAQLIMTELYGSGMNAVQFCSLLREDALLRGVSVIVFCRDNEVELREAERCRANAVLALPAGHALLRGKVQQFLSISSRGTFHTSFSARRPGGSPQQSIDCRTENISATGMFIEANADLKQGDRLLFSLALPPAATFSTQAEVVRTVKSSASSSANRYGVRFSRLDPAARRAIESLVGQSSL